MTYVEWCQEVWEQDQRDKIITNVCDAVEGWLNERDEFQVGIRELHSHMKSKNNPGR